MEIQIIEQDLYQWIVNSLESPPEENNGVRHYAGFNHYEHPNESIITPHHHTQPLQHPNPNQHPHPTEPEVHVSQRHPPYKDCYVKLEKLNCPKKVFVCSSCHKLFKVGILII